MITVSPAAGQDVVGSEIPPPPRQGRRAPSALAPRLFLTAELIAATVLYTVGAGRSGWGNTYYAAATQAGALSWHAFLFGAVDPTGGMSIDKPPAAIWLSALATRVFGLSPESVLWPQAACGVAAVALLYATVARQAGRPAGLLAGGLLAVTPVATLMARYNNPDELMVLLLVAAAYTATRAVQRDRGGLGWVTFTGLLVGTAFLTKLGQAFLVVPGLALPLIVATPGTLWRRLGRLVAGGVGIVVGGGWWVLVVALTPAADRPYVGGSTDNSVLGLALGYDGLDRLTGSHPASSSADWSRLFISGGQQAGWLLPAALALTVAALAWTWHRPRTDVARAGLLLWSGWLVGAGVVLSSLKGISHSYYSVQIAPAAAALVAIGATLAWQRSGSVIPRTAARARLLLAGTALLSAGWMAGLLPSGAPWAVGLGAVIVATGAVGAVGVFRMRAASSVIRAIMAGALVISAVAGPLAVSVVTAQAVHQGSGPRAGVGSTILGPGPVPAALADLVRAGAPGFDWAAGVPARKAADLQLASGVPVFELGGYKGRDPAPTLTQFQEWVAAGRIHYLVLPGGTGPGGAPGGIGAWVDRRFPVQRIDGWTVIDLTQPLRTGAIAGSSF